MPSDPVATPAHTPSEDRAASLLDEQIHAYNGVTGALERLGPVLSGTDRAGLEAGQTAIAAGGDIATLETATDALQSVVSNMTPVLGADDLAALNAAVTSMQYITGHLRPGDVMLPLDLPEEPPPDAMAAGDNTLVAEA